MCLLLLVVDNEMPADPVGCSDSECAVVAARPESCHRLGGVRPSIVAPLGLEVVESVGSLLSGDLLNFGVAAGRVVVAETYVVLVGVANLEDGADEDLPVALSRVSGPRSRV